MGKKLKEFLWPLGGTLLALLVVPIAIEQYPEVFKDSRWILPVSMGVVALCWIVPLLVHDRARRVWRSGYDRFGAGPTAIGVGVVVILCVLVFSRMYRFHVHHLESRLNENRLKSENHPPTNQAAPTPPPIQPPSHKQPHPTNATTAPPPILLPPLHKTDSFITYVLFNAGDPSNPFVCPVGTSVRIFACDEFAQFVAKKTIPDQRGLPRSGAVALQHYLVSLVESAAEGWGMHGVDEGGKIRRIMERQIPPIDIPDRQVYELEQALNPTPADRTFFTPDLVFKHQIRLPINSTASFVHLVADTEHPDSYVLRLERAGYYKLDLNVSSYGRNEKGSIPENYQLSEQIDTSQITAYYYQISLDMTIQRTNDPSFVVSEYEEWGKALFVNIREKLEH